MPLPTIKLILFYTIGYGIILMQSFQLVKGVCNLQIILFANVPKNISLQKLQSLLNVLLS